MATSNLIQCSYLAVVACCHHNAYPPNRMMESTTLFRMSDTDSRPLVRSGSRPQWLPKRTGKSREATWREDVIKVSAVYLLNSKHFQASYLGSKPGMASDCGTVHRALSHKRHDCLLPAIPVTSLIPSSRSAPGRSKRDRGLPIP